MNRGIAAASGSTACEGMAAISTRPVVSPLDRLDAEPGQRHPVRHLPGRPDQRPPGLGEHHPPPDPVEQLGAEVPFQRSDRLRQRRLGDVERLGRPVEAAVVDDGEEVPQLANVHPRIIARRGRPRGPGG